jgi:hypothetical protein
MVGCVGASAVWSDRGGGGGGLIPQNDTMGNRPRDWKNYFCSLNVQSL